MQWLADASAMLWPITFGVVVDAVPEPLILYTVVPRTIVRAICSDGYLRVKTRGPDALHIELKMSLAEAIDDASLYYGRVSKDSHCALQVVFTPPGADHYATTCAGSMHSYQTVLCKEIFHDDVDRGVWHFQQDLPLLAYDQQGTCLIHSTWLQIM